ncbi:DUF4157 domain-containing protein [Streptomyces sp. NPDC002680]|uniref:eCIS core domain-containing protein n=1 Tax=Streptomyces sp. NPDC002680 TaxID=3364659 RepID=UPI0036BFFE65
MRAQDTRTGGGTGPERARRTAPPTPAHLSARNSPAHLSAGGTPAQRLLTLQRLAGNAAVARAVAEERHEHDGNCGHGTDVQRSPDSRRDVQRSAVHEVLRSAGRPLDTPLRAEMEGRYGGQDFSGVRVHTDAVAQRSAAEIGAKAYTSGSHVVWDGQDKHTLAHELQHVVQQSRGAVPGTDDGSGLRVSDPGDWAERQAEETARKVMSGPAPVQRTTTPDSGTAASSPGLAVQRKGQEKVGGQVTVEEPAPEQSAGGKLTAWLKKGPPPVNQVTAPVRALVAEYDNSSRRGPEWCMGKLGEIQVLALEQREEARPVDTAYLEDVLKAVNAELVVVGRQVARDTDMRDAPGLPYKDMTDRGTLWKDAQFPESTVNFATEGFSYVREMSELNRGDLSKEIGDRSRAWVRDVSAKLEAELRQAVVAHYSPKARIDSLDESGDNRLKSRTTLDQERVAQGLEPLKQHNTMNVDKLMLGNDGFVFFYIEHPGTTGRKSRFAEGQEGEGKDEARIELGLEESGLLSQGWIMLSDLVQRDYPKLVADPRTPHLPVSSKSKNATDKHVPVRAFEKAQPSEDEFMNSLEAFQGIQDTESRQAHQLARQLAVTDSANQMVYGPEKIVKHPELLHKNILAGADIIPGLVDRAVVEIMRFEESNPPLATRMKGMSGADLMDFLFHALLRPQAMIPNTVDLSAAKITYTTGT